MPEPLPPVEDASLYVLDLLDPEAKRSFEAGLAASPDLQRHLADLRTNLDALALAVPPANPPPRVWNLIAERTAGTPPHAAPAAPSGWALIRAWLTNGWAVATLIATAFVVHLLLDPAAGPASLPVSSQPATPDVRAATPPGTHVLAGGTPARTPGSARPPNDGSAATSASPSALGPDPQEARLQDRVRLLTDQVALLHRVLSQQPVLPAGSARLQVFRLVATNPPNDALEGLSGDPRRLGDAGSPSAPAPPSSPIPSPAPTLASTTPPTAPTGIPTGTSSTPGTGTDSFTASEPDVSLTLALAAARQLAGVQPAPSTPTTLNRSANNSSLAPIPDPAGLDATDSSSFAGFVNPAIPAEPPVVRDPIQIVDLANPIPPGRADVPSSGGDADTGLVATSEGSAFGAFSPDTGQGAIAFRIPGSPGEAGVLQLWITDTQTGQVRSLGFTPFNTAANTSPVMVMKFNVEGYPFTAPTFMITREPVGGSVAPTGPVVALPPATALPNPAP